MLLLVLNPILILVFFNSLVMLYVSFPVYVNVAHFVVVVCCCPASVFCFVGFGWGGGFVGFVGKPLLCRILDIIEVSFLRCSPCML
jgi:hypothetical protein